jgi:GxxExxY protein
MKIKNKTTEGAEKNAKRKTETESFPRDSAFSVVKKGGAMPLLYEDESYKINGSLFEVYRQLGNGFLESVYQEAVEYQLKKDDIPFKSQKEISIYYDGKPLKQFYKADIICYDNIIVELKAIKILLNEHKAQLMHYLKATNMKLGLLANFGSYPKIDIQRIIYENKRTTKGAERNAEKERDIQPFPRDSAFSVVKKE